MAQTNDNLIDVLIVGAGPAGLMMACQLALHKINFRIIDKKSSPTIYSGALIIHARTLEIFQQLGISEKVLELGIIPRTIKIQVNKRKNYSIDISGFGGNLTPFPYLVMIEQWQTERILQKYLTDNKCFIENNTSIKSFSQNDSLVISEISKPDGSKEIIKSKFLIGADGNDSFVRKHLKIPFTGKTQNSRLFISDCNVNLPASENEILFLFTNNITTGFFPFKGNRWRVDGLIPSIQHRDVNFNDIADHYFKKLPDDISLTNPSWFSIFRSHSRCADQFRLKRCFLIGDAAHVHSPVGAQGMNTGIQDAYNLAWKVAYFIQGKASKELLDTYQLERRPVALKTIHFTDLAYSFMTSNKLFAKFFRLHLVPLFLPKFIDLINNNQKIRARVFTAISGIGIKYSHNISSLSTNDGFNKQVPKPGERMLPLIYDNQSILNNDLKYTHFCFYVFVKDTLPASFQNIINKYKSILNVKYLNIENDNHFIQDSLGIKDTGYYLIRPDQYIACRSNKFNADELNNYLQKYFV